MGLMNSATLPRADEDVDTLRAAETPWQTVVWNDPVNLMSYVAYVFRSYFGYSKKKAEKLMMQVHEEGRAVVSSGPREQAEMDVHRLHAHGLQATLSQD